MVDLKPENSNVYRVIGLMSGTSLDGVDLASCIFTFKNNCWSYQIDVAETFPYPEEWLSCLPSLMKAGAYTYAKANADLGYYFGRLLKTFVLKHVLETDFVASHGHTIFHQPGNGLTSQIGSGAAMAATCGLPVINDFRSTDVALGGQGAPLVPVGDALLFSDYDFCLNLGGFSNVSYAFKGQRIAYDVSPVNTILNQLANRIGMDYDQDGLIARSGNVDLLLLKKLNTLGYYVQKSPKSLGFEWCNEYIWPLIKEANLSVPDLLRTMVEQIAVQLAMNLEEFDEGTILVTGGGAKNKFLIERFAAHSKHKLIVPADQIIDYKEALIFAFLGVLRVRGVVNCLSSVTGATRDSIGGAIYLP